MKKLIFAALLIASTGVFASFKSDTAATKHDTVTDRKELGTADDRKELGTADDRKELGTADARTHRHATNDRKELGTAD